jgi:hypothetical protein
LCLCGGLALGVQALCVAVCLLPVLYLVAMLRKLSPGATKCFVSRTEAASPELLSPGVEAADHSHRRTWPSAPPVSSCTASNYIRGEKWWWWGLPKGGHGRLVKKRGVRAKRLGCEIPTLHV